MPRRDTTEPATAACPCGSGRPYAECCGPLLAGERSAADAEALMRSRYTAYVRRDQPYLLATWHPSTRPAPPLFDDDDAPTRWLGLQVRAHLPQGERAEVEFVARFKVGGRAQRLHERSRFVREGGQWLYVDGDLAPPA
jgi:SEC-C motif-containing protein